MSDDTDHRAVAAVSTKTDRSRGHDFLGLHVLADDDSRWTRDPVEQARLACEAGASVVQLRTKHASDATTLDWARSIRELTLRANVRFVVNDRLDIADLAGADGVHLGQDDIPPSAIPKDLRRRLAVGRSTHTPSNSRRPTTKTSTTSRSDLSSELNQRTHPMRRGASRPLSML